MNDLVECILEYQPIESFELEFKETEHLLLLYFKYKIRQRTIVTYTLVIQMPTWRIQVPDYPFCIRKHFKDDDDPDTHYPTFSFLDIVQTIHEEPKEYISFWIGDQDVSMHTIEVTPEKTLRILGQSRGLNLDVEIEIPAKFCVNAFEKAHQIVLDFLSKVEYKGCLTT